MLIIPTTPIPVSGQIGERCGSFIDPKDHSRNIEDCCPEGHHWEWEHPGPSNGYWGCEKN